MPSVTENLQNRIAGVNSILELMDSADTVFKFQPDATLKAIKVYKDGTQISAPFLRPVTTKAADYTVLATECGTLFVATAAANFTLPNATTCAGVWFEFYNAADSNMTITSTPADSLVVFNDAAADSIAFSTAGEKIGVSVKVTSDGTKWLAQVMLPAEAVTSTIVTA